MELTLKIDLVLTEGALGFLIDQAKQEGTNIHEVISEIVESAADYALTTKPKGGGDTDRRDDGR